MQNDGKGWMEDKMEMVINITGLRNEPSLCSAVPAVPTWRVKALLRRGRESALQLKPYAPRTSYPHRQESVRNLVREKRQVCETIFHVQKLGDCYLETNEVRVVLATCLNGIPEPGITLKYDFAPIRSRILSLEHQSIDDHNETNQTICANAEGNSEVEVLQYTLVRLQKLRRGTIPTGLSCCLNTVEPAIPPSPPNPTSVAEAKARFHWPRMLLAW
jgi:hypothetical protein